jgi:hypothetical protein
MTKHTYIDTLVPPPEIPDVPLPETPDIPPPEIPNIKDYAKWRDEQIALDNDLLMIEKEKLEIYRAKARFYEELAKQIVNNYCEALENLKKNQNNP